MGRGYKQLSLEDRCEIARLQAEGRSIQQIAAALDRAPSTVAREIRRNRGTEVGYKPSYAHEQARARRWVGSRLERQPKLQRVVLGRLAKGWSPEQVAGRLRREGAHFTISYESIYRFIYAQIARTKDYRWRHYLPRGKSKRGFRGRRGGSSASFIERPHSALGTACGRHQPQHARPLGSRSHAVPQIWAGRADRARAPLPDPARHPTAKQGGRWGREPSGWAFRRPAAGAAPDRHLRQRHRARPPHAAQSPRAFASRPASPRRPSSVIPMPPGNGITEEGLDGEAVQLAMA